MRIEEIVLEQPAYLLLRGSLALADKLGVGFMQISLEFFFVRAGRTSCAGPVEQAFLQHDCDQSGALAAAAVPVCAEGLNDLFNHRLQILINGFQALQQSDALAVSCLVGVEQAY